jgi:hypothetical protein
MRISLKASIGGEKKPWHNQEMACLARIEPQMRMALCT